MPMGKPFNLEKDTHDDMVSTHLRIDTLISDRKKSGHREKSIS